MTYRNDHDKFMSKTPVAVNRLIQAEVERLERLAWSRLPLWKRTWLKIKRYFDLSDSYPFTDPHWTRRDKIGMILSTFLVVVFVCFLVYLAVLAIVDSIGAF